MLNHCRLLKIPSVWCLVFLSFFFLFILLGVCWSSWVCIDNFYHFEKFLVIVSSNSILLYSLSLFFPSHLRLWIHIFCISSVCYMCFPYSILVLFYFLIFFFLVLHFQYFQLTYFKFTGCSLLVCPVRF